ncbi:hypothetical protein D3C71_1840310 [compost metagenome]
MQLIAFPPVFQVEFGLRIQTAVIQATAAGAVDFHQCGIVFHHLVGTAYAAAVFTDHEHFCADRQQRQNVAQLELRFLFALRPIVDQRIALGDKRSVHGQPELHVFAHRPVQ